MINLLKTSIKATDNVVYITDNKWNPNNKDFTTEEIKYIKIKLKDKVDAIFLNRYNSIKIIVNLKSNTPLFKQKEHLRLSADKVCSKLEAEKVKNIVIFDKTNNNAFTLAFAEGLVLSNYSFLKYFTKDNPGQELEETGRLMRILRRLSDGQWKVARAIWTE